MPSQVPLCSVLICTYNRANLLHKTLEGLRAQTLNQAQFEVVIVDDGSSDETAAVVESFRGSFPSRYAYQRNAGLASARNHALFLATGETALFLDDDDLPAPTLLEQHVRTHRAFPEKNFAVLGHTRLDASIAHDPVMSFVTEVGKFLFSYPDLTDGDVLGFAHFWGGRSSCKRSFLLEYGVFNPVFRFGCEDIELAFRLSKHNFKVVYNSRAVTTMIRPFSFEQFCDRLEKQGRSNYVFSRLHSDAEVQKWTETPAALSEWDAIRPAYEVLRRSARQLDKIVREKMTASLPLGGDIELLHEAYSAAFRASKMKGIAEAAAESKGGPEEPVAAGRGTIQLTQSASLRMDLEPELKALLDSSPSIHETVTWGLGRDTLLFLEERVTGTWRTLETGCGLSTMLFAYKGTLHTCVTPCEDEALRVKGHCAAHGVSTERVTFAIGCSDRVLPGLLSSSALDLVLIDGCHGFPMPFVDWLYCAPRLGLGGILVVDDTHLWTGGVLKDFLLSEPDWELEATFARGAAFRKVREFRSKEWTEQPYVVRQRALYAESHGSATVQTAQP